MSNPLPSPPYIQPYPSSAQSSLLQPFASTPPPPPPKANSSQTGYSGPPIPPPPSQNYPQQQWQSPPTQSLPQPPNPEDSWIPEILQDKSKPDLESLLQSTELLSSLVNAPSTTHPAYAASLEPLNAALQRNMKLASFLNTSADDLSSMRSKLTSQLLSLHALERQWRHKQADMDNALEPWSPKALHARLVASIVEQEMLCQALEESFLERSDERASEREVAEWVKRYKEGQVVLGLRKERRARFDEGRVGGWR